MYALGFLRLGSWFPGLPGGGECPACPIKGVCTPLVEDRLCFCSSCPHPCPPTVAWELGVLCGKGRALGLEIAKCGQK